MSCDRFSWLLLAFDTSIQLVHCRQLTAEQHFTVLARVSPCIVFLVAIKGLGTLTQNLPSNFNIFVFYMYYTK